MCMCMGVGGGEGGVSAQSDIQEVGVTREFKYSVNVCFSVHRDLLSCLTTLSHFIKFFSFFFSSLSHFYVKNFLAAGYYGKF